MSGRVFISAVPSWSGLAAILRSEAAPGVSVTPLHFEDAQWRGDAAGPVAPEVAAGRGGAARKREGKRLGLLVLGSPFLSRKHQGVSAAPATLPGTDPGNQEQRYRHAGRATGIRNVQ
jgi:hypothetical protein